jgi:2,3-bisphosphoglycerate-dependent phosphoglycerate mutase
MLSVRRRNEIVVTSFILIRHADSPWSEDENRPLSSAGALTAESLAERLGGYSISAIYSSPYRRSLQTVLPLAERLGLSISEVFDLRERTLGSFQDASFEEAVAATWSDFSLVYPGGESSRSAQERAVAVARGLARRHASQTVVLATHGNLLALLLNGFDPNVSFDFWRSLAFPDAFELCLFRSGRGVFRRIEGCAV